MIGQASSAADSLLAAVPSAAYRDDPYPFLAELRRTAPVCRASVGVWLLTRYADVYGIVRDPSLGHAPAGAGSQDFPARSGLDEGDREPEFRPLSLLDGPAHARIRTLLGTAFPPRAAEPLRPTVEALAQDLADRLATSRSAVDLVSQYALPLALAPACDLVAIPADDRPSVAGWGAVLAASGDPPFLLDDETRLAAERAQKEFGSYLAALVVRRRRSGGDDVISRLVAARCDGDRLSFAELVANVGFFVVNGYHNTVNLIASTILALLRHPEQLGLLAAEPARTAAAIDEAARFDSPIHAIGRYAREDYEVDGVRIPAGEAVMALVGAAHRDPEAFEDPDRFELRRASSHPLLTFGGGDHSCMGARLALMEAEIGVRTLLERFPRLRLAGAPVPTPTFTLRGPATLPVRLR